MKKTLLLLSVCTFPVVYGAEQELSKKTLKTLGQRSPSKTRSEVQNPQNMAFADAAISQATGGSINLTSAIKDIVQNPSGRANKGTFCDKLEDMVNTLEREEIMKKETDSKTRNLALLDLAKKRAGQKGGRK